MDLIRLFVRMALIARRRPSSRRLVAFGVVLAICLGLALLQRLGLTPDWMTATRPGRIHGF